MTEQQMPWYVRLVVGIGAWITAVVAMVLGGTIVFLLLELERAIALAAIGALYLWLGVWLLRQADRGIFASQIGIAMAAAGAALTSGGIAAEFEEVWTGLPVATAIAIGIFLLTGDRIVRFLAAALVAAFFIATLEVEHVPYVLDIVALATPVGLYLLLSPPVRDITPASLVLVLTFPLFAVFVAPDLYWFRDVNMGGWVARAIHIGLFIWLIESYRRQRGIDFHAGSVAFVLAAAAVSVLLPPGGSAALVLMTFAYVTGSPGFATFGALLQVQFIIRYYYSLEMTLLNKSWLLMAVGIVLLGAWWLLQKPLSQGEPK